MKIVIGSDHAGFELKQLIFEFLLDSGQSVSDLGTDSADSFDYPDVAHPLASVIENKDADMGILICGSGNGVCMTANKHQGIRAAIAWNRELAELSRHHNDANVLCIPARFVNPELAKEMVFAFMNASFDGGRHIKRVDKIAINK